MSILSITLTFRKETHQLNLPPNSTVNDALKKLKILHTTVITVRNKQVIPESTQLNDHDALELINVLSGG